MKDRSKFVKHALIAALLIGGLGVALNPANYTRQQNPPRTTRAFGGGGGHGFQTMPGWMRAVYDAYQSMKDWLSSKPYGGGGGGGI